MCLNEIDSSCPFSERTALAAFSTLTEETVVGLAIPVREPDLQGLDHLTLDGRTGHLVD
jgi:hypothetical protein